MTSDVRLVMVESPTNPRLRCVVASSRAAVCALTAPIRAAV
jgi:hypothetical protein